MWCRGLNYGNGGIPRSEGRRLREFIDLGVDPSIGGLGKKK